MPPGTGGRHRTGAPFGRPSPRGWTAPASRCSRSARGATRARARRRLRASGTPARRTRLVSVTTDRAHRAPGTDPLLVEERCELAADDLVHGIPRKRIDEDPALRNLVLREVGKTMRGELLGGDRGAG